MSEPQQHSFNKPYSIGKRPKHRKQVNKAASTEHQMQDKDIIVMGSDGVWDNLYL